MALSERDLQAAIIRLAKLSQWRVYHTWNSQHSPDGFPDLCLVRDGQLLFAELKSARGKVTPAQHAWLEALGNVPGVEVYVWQPADWLAGVVEDILLGRVSSGETA